MQIGLLFPQTEIGTDPGGIRAYAQAAYSFGFTHLVSYEHVLGAEPARLPKDYAPYGLEDEFHEILTTWAYLAGVAPGLGLATSILVLPQRQTALVAKQAAQLSLLSGGRFRLGVGIGWNYAEFEGMGVDFRSRARRFEEQIRLLRRLWTEPVVRFQGEFDHIDGCGIRPLPASPIPIWIGGSAESALRRAAQLGDGFFPLRPMEGGWPATLERMRTWRAEAGLAWEGFGIEARVTVKPGWRDEVEQWREWGASHLYLATPPGMEGAQAHIKFLETLV
ncbi:LLM class F420-dependent oxidoreductase [bacterium]|nr:LLM class F420-dependent oxidoreductase [bacterium]